MATTLPPNAIPDAEPGSTSLGQKYGLGTFTVPAICCGASCGFVLEAPDYLYYTYEYSATSNEIHSKTAMTYGSYYGGPGNWTGGGCWWVGHNGTDVLVPKSSYLTVTDPCNILDAFPNFIVGFDADAVFGPQEMVLFNLKRAKKVLTQPYVSLTHAFRWVSAPTPPIGPLTIRVLGYKGGTPKRGTKNGQIDFWHEGGVKVVDRVLWTGAISTTTFVDVLRTHVDLSSGAVTYEVL